jgi:hypothetical protein
MQLRLRCFSECRLKRGKNFIQRIEGLAAVWTLVFFIVCGLGVENDLGFTSPAPSDIRQFGDVEYFFLLAHGFAPFPASLPLPLLLS